MRVPLVLQECLQLPERVCRCDVRCDVYARLVAAQPTLRLAHRLAHRLVLFLCLCAPTARFGVRVSLVLQQG